MRRASQINLATLYSGRALHAIDDSNRIMLPAEWRVEGAANQFFVIVAPSDQYLIICPPPVFESFLDDLRNGLADKTQIPQMERELNDRVRQVTLDRFGRLPLPPELMARAGIAKQGEIIGRFSKFEVWARGTVPSPEQNGVSELLSRKLSTL